MPYILETHNLTKFYGKFRGIEDVNLAIEAGEIFGFLGPNGAGKTTTIRILLDLVRSSSGSYRILGCEGSQRHFAIRDAIGNLPGEVGFYANMTGRQLLDYLGNYQRNGKPVLTGELCERFQFSAEALAKKIKHYSKGMKQKLALIQAMQHNPKLLILDEPSEALDPLMQQALYDTLLDFKKRGATLFFSSHILAEVEKICDRVAIIRAGRIQTIARIDTLKQKLIRRLTIVAERPALDQVSQIIGITPEAFLSDRAVYRFQGEIGALLRTLAGLPIHNIIFPEPQLEDVFLGYYQ